MYLFRHRNLDSITRTVFAAAMLCLALDFLLPGLAAKFSQLHPAVYNGTRILLLFWAMDMFFWLVFEKLSAADSSQPPAGFHVFPLLPKISFCLLIGLLCLAAAIGWQQVLAPVLHLPQGQQGFCQGPCANLLSHFGL
jgi:hypothetical protein